MGIILKNKLNNAYGFMLLEVVLTMAVIAILAGTIVIAINPPKRLEDTHNSQRSEDINHILTAIQQYSLNNSGSLPNMTTTATEICATGASSCEGLIDLSLLTTLAPIPKDPQCLTLCSANSTGYTVQKTADDHVTVSAPKAEQGRTITITQ